MRILQSALFRALCAIVIGVLLIRYREQTMTWITITIGVLFFLSGIISLTTYFVFRKNTLDVEIYDANGKQIAGQRPAFPLVSVGSVILGLILALMPNTFVGWLMFILAFILILGAINQFAVLLMAKRFARVSPLLWIFPSVILLVALVALLYPSAIASAPLFILGWCMLIYGVSECVNQLKLRRARKNQSRRQGQDASDAELIE